MVKWGFAIQLFGFFIMYSFAISGGWYFVFVGSLVVIKGLIDLEERVKDLESEIPQP